MSALPSRILLTGFMGSGKSTVGPIVANVLGYAFADLDELVEAVAGQPIPRIFAAYGETGFREREAEALRRLVQQDEIVGALGGGTLASQPNLDLARARAFVVYLHVSPDRLVRRLRAGQSGRPLLCDADGRPLAPQALLARITTLLAAREPFYRKAHVTIDASRQRTSDTVEAVLEAVHHAGTSSFGL